MSRSAVDVWHLDLLAASTATGLGALALARLVGDRWPPARDLGPAGAVVLAAATGYVPGPAAAVAAVALLLGALGRAPGRAGALVAAAAAVVDLRATPLVSGSVAVIAVALLAVSRRPRPAPALLVVVAGVAAVVVWAQVPDTKMVVVVAPAVVLPLLPDRDRSVDRVVAAALVLVWAAGVGAEGRPAAIAGVWSAAALLAGALAWTTRAPGSVPPRWRAAVAAAALPGALALLAARTVGVADAPMPVAAAAMAAANGLSWSLVRWASTGRGAADRSEG